MIFFIDVKKAPFVIIRLSINILWYYKKVGQILSHQLIYDPEKQLKFMLQDFLKIWIYYGDLQEE
jgi:hypothetical protein